MQANEIFLAGHLGRNAEFTVTKNGHEMATFSIAHTIKGKDGRPDQTTWFKIVCFSYMAKAAQAFKKGDNVFVRGSNVALREYNKKDGSIGHSLELMANSVFLVGKPLMDLDTVPDVGTQRETLPRMPDFGDDDIPF